MTVDYGKRVYGLDVYRAVAILLVVRVHASVFAPNLFEGFPFIPLIDGVELFFALSGFLIGGILIRMIQENEDFSFSDLLTFWKRRWFRTLPNYYLILVLNILVVKIGLINANEEQITWKFIFFIQNLSQGFYDFFWESWSLSIEEWFYIILPILAATLYKLMGLKRAFLVTILSLLVIPLLYRMYCVPIPTDYFWWDVSIRKVVITRMDAIIYGVLGAYLAHYHKDLWFRFRWPMFMLGLVLIYSNRLFNITWNSFYGRTFYFSVLSLGCMLLIPLAASVKEFKRPWIGKSITHISLISYSMYLINLGLVAQVIAKNFLPLSRTETAGMYLVYWTVVIGVSTVLYRYFELPMMKLRDRF